MKNEQEHTETIQAIRTAIRKIARTYGVDTVEIVVAEVMAVDKVKRTCDVKPVTGKGDTPIEGVFLNVVPNDGEIKVPAVGSMVVVVQSTYNKSYVIGFSDLTEWNITISNTVIDMVAGTIQFGDGSYDGLIKIIDITAKLNNLVTEITALKTAFNSHTHPTAATGSPSMPTISFTGNFSNFNKTDYENNNIKHGTT